MNIGKKIINNGLLAGLGKQNVQSAAEKAELGNGKAELLNPTLRNNIAIKGS